MEPNTTQPTPKKSISTGAAIVTAAVIIALALIIVFAPRTANTPKGNAPAQPAEVTSVSADIATIRPNDRIRGDASTAEVAVIEYSDSDCSYCARFHTTMQTLFDEYKGKLAWVYRYYPLDSLHPNATTEAVALECVAQLGGNDAFNKYLDILINTTLNADPKSNIALTTFATAQGVNASRFESCMADTKASDRVAADAAEAQKIGAAGTPFSIVVNLKTGKQVIVPGAYPIEDMREYIDSVLK